MKPIQITMPSKNTIQILGKNCKIKGLQKYRFRFYKIFEIIKPETSQNSYEGSRR